MNKDWWKDPFQNGWYPLGSITAEWSKKTKIEAGSIKKILGLPKGARILDVGCGVGRHSIALAKLGYDVTGIDISNKYLITARASAHPQKLKPKFIQCDMRKIPYKEEFDGAVNLFSSFGYFHNPNDDLKVLSGIFRALKPNGIFLIDNMNFDFIKKHFTSQCWSELGDGTLILERRELPNSKSRVMSSHWKFVTPSGKRSEMHAAIRGYSKSNLTKCLRETGFTSIGSHRPLGGQIASLRTSPRVVLSARKSRNM